MDYKIDMAICIDPSGKVGEHIDDIKSYAVCFLDKILTSAEESGHNISALRVKFIQVSSPESGERSITETDFYSFTNGEEKEKISEVLDSVKPNGGVTKYDNFYELLKCAFNSDWTDADGARHVTAIWSDAPEVNFLLGTDEQTDRKLDELSGIWNTNWTNGRAKRLFLFTPDTEPWTDIQLWDCVYYPIDPTDCHPSDLDSLATFIWGI